MSQPSRTITGGATLIQLTILVCLIGGMLMLHALARPSADLDPTAMLAFGFVVLASYTIGNIAELAKLPHITGYLLAGVLFGPSLATFLPPFLQYAPFDKGVLSRDVIGQLSLMDSLALALIAMSAASELRLDELRKRLKSVVGLLGGQVVLILVMVVGYFALLASGALPLQVAPGLLKLSWSQVLIVGVMLGSVSIATSPASTVAVVRDVRADGPMTQTVLSSVVLKDVIVVVLFSIFSVWAAQSLIGAGATEGNLATFFLIHIGGSFLFGAAAGWGMSLYLRFVRREILLFLVGSVYALTYVANSLHLAPLLCFLAAGLTVANTSKHRHLFREAIEQLSAPVYVVYFTLAGASLHLDALAQVAPAAIGLVLCRIVAIRLGTGWGARLGDADASTQRYSWLGFISQAGVAISLAALIGGKFGSVGEGLETLLIASIALNEIIGPVLLKIALGLAGEIPQNKRSVRGSEPQPVPAPVPNTSYITLALPKLPALKSRKLARHLENFKIDLENILSESRQSSFAVLQQDIDAYFAQLRREFLRYHRRLSIHVKTESSDAELKEKVRAEEVELTHRLRTTVSSRRSRIEREAWDPTRILSAIDRAVEALPIRLHVVHEDTTPAENLSVAARLGKMRLAVESSLRRGLGLEPPRRAVRLRDLGGFNFGEAFARELEGVAALLLTLDRQVVRRSVSAFRGVSLDYEHLVEATSHADVDVDAMLTRLRDDLGREVRSSLTHVRGMADEAAQRLQGVITRNFEAFVDEAKRVSTYELPNSKRRPSTRRRSRTESFQALQERVLASRKLSRAEYRALAMELDLEGFHAAVRYTLVEAVRRIENDTRGKSATHLARVEEAMVAVVTGVRASVTNGHPAQAVAEQLREAENTITRRLLEAEQNLESLKEQLSDELFLSGLIDATHASGQAVGEQYEVPSREVAYAEWRLPEAQPLVEVPLRELIDASIEARIVPRLYAIARQAAERAHELVRALRDMERQLTLNIELAISEMEPLGDRQLDEETQNSLNDTLLESFERILESLRATGRGARQWPAELGHSIREIVLNSVQVLREEVRQRDLSALRLRMMRQAAMGHRLRRGARRLPTLLLTLRSSFLSTGRRLLGEARLARLGRRLGLRHGDAGSIPSLESLRPVAVAREIPAPYKRLFAVQTVEADLVFGIQQRVQQIRGMLASDKSGTLRTVAVVGPEGSGKGAVVAALTRGSKARLQRVAWNGPVTAEQLDELFADGSSGRIIILTGVQWLFAFHPGGLIMLRSFVERVLADGGRNAYLIQVDQPVWHSACTCSSLGDAFSEAVELRPLSPQQLKDVVLARHGASGYTLSFEPRSTTEFGDHLLRRGRTENWYFSALHAACGGLMRDGFDLWLASVEEVDRKKGVVHVGPLPACPIDSLRQMPEWLLLELYQVVRQGWIDESSLSFLKQSSLEQAKARLARLLRTGLLKASTAGVYQVPMHLRGALLVALQERGWL